MESTTFIKLIQQQGPNTNLELAAICKACMSETVAEASLGKGPWGGNPPTGWLWYPGTVVGGEKPLHPAPKPCRSWASLLSVSMISSISGGVLLTLTWQRGHLGITRN